MCVDLKTGSVKSKLCLLRPELREVSAEGKFLDTELLGNEFCGNKRGGNMCNLGGCRKVGGFSISQGRA